MIAYEEIETAAKAIFVEVTYDAMAWGIVDQSVRNYYLRLAKAALNATKTDDAH